MSQYQYYQLVTLEKLSSVGWLCAVIYVATPETKDKLL